MQVVKYAFQQHGDERGQLVALEEYLDIPFQIRRVYYMYGTKRRCEEDFMPIALWNKFLFVFTVPVRFYWIVVRKKGGSLEKPYEGLYIANDMWREMFDFSHDAVLLVLASDYYKEEDYIRNYDEFLRFIKKRR